MKTFNFFGVNIADANLESASEAILNYHFSQPTYVCFPDLYVITLCQKNEFLKSILNKAYLTLPDGKPSAYFGRKSGLKNIDPVSGYWLCRKLLNTSLSHVFLGGSNQSLSKIKNRLSTEFPNANIKGFIAPKFVSEKEAFEKAVFSDVFNQINQLKPDLIWVGISSPKQDYILYHHLPLLKHGIMLSVGGVFDYLSGDVNKSPEFLKKIGLRWLWRLLNEPKRLGPKYFYTLAKFFKMLIKSRIKKLFRANSL